MKEAQGDCKKRCDVGEVVGCMLEQWLEVESRPGKWHEEEWGCESYVLSVLSG